MQMRMLRPRGFTLVEIMVVMLILSILVSVAIPSFIRARETSRARTCQHNLKNLVGAKERWAMDHHKGAADEPTMDDLVLPTGYLKGIPQCPKNGTYTLNNMNTMPECSIGGTPGDPTAHVAP